MWGQCPDFSTTHRNWFPLFSLLHAGAVLEQCWRGISSICYITELLSSTRYQQRILNTYLCYLCWYLTIIVLSSHHWLHCCPGLTVWLSSKWQVRIRIYRERMLLKIILRNQWSSTRKRSGSEFFLLNFLIHRDNPKWISRDCLVVWFVSMFQPGCDNSTGPHSQQDVTRTFLSPTLYPQSMTGPRPRVASLRNQEEREETRALYCPHQPSGGHHTHLQHTTLLPSHWSGIIEAFLS